MMQKISDLISLKLEFGNKRFVVNIYVDGKLFRQCARLLLSLPIKKDVINVNSIDEAEQFYVPEEEEQKIIGDINLTIESEFWAHCSNLQAWVEHNYDTRLLHRNLAFPLLKRLSEVGDLKARKALKQEIAHRISANYVPVTLFLINEGYFDLLDQNDLERVLPDLNFNNLLLTLFRYLASIKGVEIYEFHWFKEKFKDKIVFTKEFIGDLLRFEEDEIRLYFEELILNKIPDLDLWEILIFLISENIDGSFLFFKLTEDQESSEQMKSLILNNRFIEVLLKQIGVGGSQADLATEMLFRLWKNFPKDIEEIILNIDRSDDLESIKRLYNVDFFYWFYRFDFIDKKKFLEKIHSNKSSKFDELKESSNYEIENSFRLF